MNTAGDQAAPTVEKPGLMVGVHAVELVHEQQPCGTQDREFE